MKFKALQVMKIGLLLICLGLFLWVPSVSAIGNIRLGRFDIHPEISYKGEWNDNIFYEPVLEEDDYIHIIKPGILVETSGEPGNFFSAGYNVGIGRYNEFSDNDYEDHRAFASLGLKTPKGFYLTAWDRFQDTDDPYGSIELFRQGLKTKRWNNRIDITPGYAFAEKWAVEAIFKNYRERYDLVSDQFQDRIYDRYGGTVLYWMTGKTAVFGQFLYDDVEYDKQNDGIDENNDGYNEWNSSNSQDYARNTFFVGARFDPKGKLKGEIKLGYGTIDFKNEADINGNPYNDDDFWLVDAAIDYQWREKTALFLDVKTSKGPSVTADRFTDVSSTFMEVWTKLKLKQNFTKRIFMDLGFDWRYRDYLDVASGFPDKEYNIYFARVGVGYLIREWLEAGIGYEYEKNDVSATVYELDQYNVNRIGFEIKGTF